MARMPARIAGGSRIHDSITFDSPVSRTLKLDWMLPNEAFDRAVHEGLREHFPELTEEARSVSSGNHSYSHAK